MSFDNKINDSCVKLWCHVLKQAIDDLFQPKYQDEALRWFNSDNDGIGTFKWVATVLDLDKSAVAFAIFAMLDVETQGGS